MLGARQAAGQNLVLNPSFECGKNLCNPTQEIDNGVFTNYACDWMIPTRGTSDVFSTKVADKNCYTSMPHAPYQDSPGSQLPHSGERFGGLYCSYVPEDNPYTYREYLQARLKEPMVVGQTYCSEVFVSRATFHGYSINSLGLRFNVGPTYEYHWNVLKQDPQIRSTTLITDSIHWTRIAGTFVADAPYGYVIFGNFSDDDHSGLVRDSYPVRYSATSYYFVDDLSVEALPSDEIAFSGKTFVCKGDTTELIAHASTSYVEWSRLGEVGVEYIGSKLKIVPEQTQTYVAVAKGCGKVVRDTITIEVRPKPVVKLPDDMTVCADTELVLDAGPGALKYRWQDQSTKQTIPVTHPGKYSVTVSNGVQCDNRDEVQINFIPLPTANLGPDQLLCSGSIRLSAKPGFEYTWSNTMRDSTIKVTRPGIYWVDVSNECGIARDEVVIYGGHDAWLPNVLTLNDDGHNETLHVMPEEAVGGRLRIYNRWGNEVFRSDTYEQDWPRQVDSVEPGIYFCTYEAAGCVQMKGTVNVVR